MPGSERIGPGPEMDYGAAFVQRERDVAVQLVAKMQEAERVKENLLVARIMREIAKCIKPTSDIRDTQMALYERATLLERGGEGGSR